MINFLTQTSLLASSKSLVGGFLFGASTLFGNPNPEAPKKPTTFDASVYVTQQGRIRLSVEKSAPTLLNVELLDPNREVLFSRTVDRDDLKTSLLLNVDQVPDGLYTLEIKSNEGIISRQVNVSTATPTRTVRFQ